MRILKRTLFLLLIIPVIIHSSILILPFENRSNRNYFWLSESISYALFSIFLEEGVNVIPPEKRNLIYEELQIPITTPLTKATSIKLARMAGAEKIIMGDFIVVDEKVIVSSRIIDLKKGKLGETISVEGEINELILLQNFLSWRLLQNIKNIDESKKDTLLRKWSNVSLPAWENFIKGLLLKDSERKEFFLLKSLNLSPEFSSCRWELSYHYFKKGDYDKCLNYIKPLSDSKPEALFISSLCHLYKKDYDKGIEGFKASLERGIKKLESANNIGVCYAKKEENEKALEYFRLALSQEQYPDVYFNIALLSNEKKEFFENIKNAIKLNPQEFIYFLLLYKRLIQWDELNIAEIIKSISKEHFSSDIDTLINDFKDLLKVIEEKKEIPSRKDEINFYKKDSISYIQSRDLSSAEASIRKAIYIHPFDWEAHLILSKILINKKDFKNALKSLNFSIWLEDRAENNLEMGKLLVETGNKEKGLEYLKKAISLNPSLQEAIDIIKKIEK